MTEASAEQVDVDVPDTPETTEVPLAAEFPEPSFEQWTKEVAKVLNRKRPEDRQLTPEQSIERLRTTTVDGIEIEPIYTRDDAVGDLGYTGVAPFTRGTTVRSGAIDAWDVRALYEDPDVDRTAKAIETDLDRGVTSLWLRVDPDAIKPEDLKDSLKSVLLELAKVDVSSRTDQNAAAQALLDVMAESDKPKDHLSFNLGLDPIGAAALAGDAPSLDGLGEWVKKLDGYHDARAIVVDSTIYHNAGAGDVQEAAWAVATAIEYVRALVEQGVDANQAFKSINFRVTATTDQFLTIARLRALRLMWDRVGEVFDVDAANRGARQHAVTSWREVTRDDAYVNILRGTISTFSAAVGGAEAITTLPFDTAWGLPGDSSRRIARNTGIILAEESNIGRVNDPAGGNWYVEKLTRQIADKAWAELQKIEAAGGMAKAVADGVIASELDEINAKRAKLINTRKLPITGVSEFPQLVERTPNVTERPEAVKLDGLTWRRDSEVFEAMRDAVAAAEGEPSVFLACLGTRRDFGGREGFSAPLFHVAGLQTPSSEGGTPEEIAEQFKAANTKVACLCSSAKVYEEQAIPVAKALKEAGAERVILAGQLKELGDQDPGDAIDQTIAMGVDVVDVLNTVLDTLGVAR